MTTVPARWPRAGARSRNSIRRPSPERVVTALSRLPVKLAAAFVLRHYHGYSNREIAAATGVSERMVGMRLAQARERLAGDLEPGRLPNSASPRVPLSESGDA